MTTTVAGRRALTMQDVDQSPNAGLAIGSEVGHRSSEKLAPLAWLEVAAKLPGKSLHLAVVLLHLAAIDQTRRVVVSNLACERFGLNRNAKYRALRSMQNAGLITAERKLGRSPIVMISCGDGTA